MPVQLTPTPRQIKVLPSYVLVGVCGFLIYVRTPYEQKVAECAHISCLGPPAPPSPSVFLFTTSNLMVSSVFLLEALEHAQIAHVAIFCFGMKCQHHMDSLTTLTTNYWRHHSCMEVRCWLQQEVNVNTSVFSHQYSHWRSE